MVNLRVAPQCIALGASERGHGHGQWAERLASPTARVYTCEPSDGYIVSSFPNTLLYS
jgi:hypothetical protein